MTYLLDTDICSYLMKRSSPALIEKVSGFPPQALKVSSVTVFELEYGIRRSAHPERIERVVRAFLENVESLPFDDQAAQQAGAVRATLAATGRIIGAYDLLIAGHARAAGATLVTNNVREFSRVEGLEVENWV